MKDKTFRREAIIAGICGALLALFYLFFTPKEWLGEESAIAQHIALGHGYLNPYNPSATAKPTAISPPALPYMIATVYKIAGIDTRACFIILYGINVLCEALVAAGIFVLAYKFFGKTAARWSLVCFLLYPAFGRNAVSIWDTLPGLAMFIWLLVWCRDMHDKRSANLPRMAGLGLGLAMLALAHTTAMLTFPFLVTMAIGRTSISKWLRLSIVAFAAFLLAVTPWTIRNYQIFGRIFAIRDGLPMEFYVGNQPGTYGSHVMRGHPATDPVERDRLDALGENRYFDELHQRFLVEYRSDRAAYWLHTANRFGFLFIDSLPEHRFRFLRIGIEAGFLALCLAGLGFAWQLNYRCTWLFGLCLLSVFPYIFTEVALSYTLPLRAGLMVYGGFAITTLAGLVSKGKLPRPQGAMVSGEPAVS
jgi:4-amino-4-deoxy-L-arabinose transferase-like glycosyltransferase